jgi:hypothetical protein
MWHTEIPPPCETLAFYSHVRHWNYTACIAWLWNSSVSNSCIIPVSHMAVECQCLTWWWDFSVSHGCGISEYRVGLKFQCHKWLWWRLTPSPKQTTTYAISVYHHWCCEFESRSGRGALDITLCDKVCQWLATGRWLFSWSLRIVYMIKWFCCKTKLVGWFYCV